jgi:hypothetical protein
MKGRTRGLFERESNAYKILVRILLGRLPFSGVGVLQNGIGGGEVVGEGWRMMKLLEDRAKWRVLILAHLFLILSHH